MRSETQPLRLIVLAQADLVFLLADLLRPPHERRRARWASATQVLDELTACAGFSQRLLRGVLGEALMAASVAETDCWSDEYQRLFDGAMLCPPNETAYVRRDKGAVIGDICGFYRAFGFATAASSGEKPDHIVTELEFVGLLLVMLAEAPDHERAQVVREALGEFADAHVGEWLSTFCARLETLAELVLFKDAACALGELWSALAQAHGWRQQPSAHAGPDPEPDEPYECGMAQAGGAVEMRVRGRAIAPVPP
jgi:TorA maturation chaperone TorD